VTDERYKKTWVAKIGDRGEAEHQRRKKKRRRKGVLDTHSLYAVISNTTTAPRPQKKTRRVYGTASEMAGTPNGSEAGRGAVETKQNTSEQQQQTKKSSGCVCVTCSG
jgi:hypothetical protein